MLGRNEYKELNRMLDLAISGDFNEESFDESELSKFQTKFKRYLANASMSEKRLNEEKDKLKELITDISHQTKTPMTNIIMYSELSSEIAKDGAAREYADEICAQSKKLGELIEALSKMSRLESGIFQFQKKPVSLFEIAEGIIKQGEPKAKKRNIRLSFEEDPDMKDIKITADSKWLTEAVYNIFDNSIKYSEDNSLIEIEIFCYEMFCGIRVKDYGAGISEEEIPLIFSRFYRGKGAGDKEGIGVGLYLARSIIEEHGGYIKIKSEVGVGTTADICFPNI